MAGSTGRSTSTRCHRFERRVALGKCRQLESFGVNTISASTDEQLLERRKSVESVVTSKVGVVHPRNKLQPFFDIRVKILAHGMKKSRVLVHLTRYFAARHGASSGRTRAPHFQRTNVQQDQSRRESTFIFAVLLDCFRSQPSFHLDT